MSKCEQPKKMEKAAQSTSNHFERSYSEVGKIFGENRSLLDAIEDLAAAHKMQAQAIKESGANISTAILESSSKITGGLSKISDEMERKRKTEEYYALLDLIDKIEDKIIGRGGNLKNIYDNIDYSNSPKIINLTIPEIRLIMRLINEEQKEWLMHACKLKCLNPLHVLYGIIKDSEVVIKRLDEGMRLFIDETPIGKLHIATLEENDRIWVSDNTKLSFLETLDTKLSGHRKNVFLQVVTGNAKLLTCPVIDDYESDSSYHDRYTYSLCGYVNFEIGDYGCELECSTEMKAALLDNVIRYYENTSFMSTDEMKELFSWQAIISELNYEITLINLRKIHEALLNAYKSLKIG